MTRELPTELLHEIAEYLSTPELVSLCSASKLFNAVSTVLLYREISLEEPVETIICCKTLSCNILAARSVRSCIIICYSRSHYSSAFYRVIYSALTHLHGIIALDLSFLTPIPHSYLKDIQHCSFPNLQFLDLEMELTPSVIRFMRRNNPHIRELYISSDVDSLSSAPLCTFPKLECFSGRFELMRAFLPGSLVQRITTSFCATDNVESGLCVLSEITIPLESIAIHSDTWDLRFFESLSRHAPRILNIDYEVEGQDADIVAAVTTSVTSLLAGFKCIQNLDMAAYQQSKDWGVISSQFRDDYEVLQSRKQICPSLRRCRLPARNLQWVLLDGGLWTPCWEDGRTRACMLRLPASDMLEFSWLKSLVENLCGGHFSNPFNNVQSAHTEDTPGSPPSTENEDDSGQSIRDTTSDAKAFIGLVRTSLQLANQT